MNQQEQAGGGGGINIWKSLLIMFAVQWIIGKMSNSSTNVKSYRNAIRPDATFDLDMRINNSDWHWSEHSLLYNTNTELSMNITMNGSELLRQPYINFRIKGADFQIQSGVPLTHYLKVKREEKKNLLFDQHDEYMIKKQDEEITEKSWHVITRVQMLLIHDTNSYPVNQVPPQLKAYDFQVNLDELIYIPHVDVDSYSVRRKDYLEIVANETYQIQLEFSCYWVWKYLMVDSIKNSGKVYESYGLENMYDETSQDNIKEMLFETNIYLVSLTMLVSLLHTVFSTLAIKNDYQYWKNLGSQEGISVRTLYTNFVIDIIITLYLLDNETSFLILIQQFVELGLMVWKIGKTTKFTRVSKFPYFKPQHQQSYVTKTQQYDQQAAKYLYITLIPLFIGYLGYALIYQEHKGFYSFIIESLVGFIYIFGFINMTPQLYINYKLKSVAHLPWRNMIYKFLNTIIDDLFAFIITMPWLKRLSCFRDDLIFLIYIYQRRIYKVDMRRMDIGTEHEMTKVDETETKTPEAVEHQKLD